MKTGEKTIAAFLSFVLSFSLMGVPAYADERHTADETDSEAIQTYSAIEADDASSVGSSEADGQTMEDKLDDQGIADSKSDSLASLDEPSIMGIEEDGASQEDVPTIVLPLADTVSFVYVDAAAVASGDVQYIAVGFSDESLIVQDAVLYLKSSSTSEDIVLSCAAVTQGAVLFAFEPSDSDIASYVIDSLRWGSESEGYSSVSFKEDSEKSNTYAFEVVTQELAQALGKAAEVSESEDAAVLAIDDDGNLTACASVEEALSLSDPDAAIKGQAGESIVSDQEESDELYEDSEAGLFEGNEESSQDVANETANVFQATLDSIVAFFRSLFVPEVAYAQVSSARENYLIVAIDPGHGGYDSGAVGNGLLEKDINLSIATHFRDELLTYSGVSTYMTREDDTFVSLQDRVDWAVWYGADVFISVHCNATGTGSGYGAEVWVPNYASYMYQETHVAGYELGEKIIAQLTKLGLHNRGVKTRDCTSGDTYDGGSTADYYTVIYRSRLAGIPGIIVEHAFIDNASDADTYLASESSRKELGIADATGVANQYSLLKDSKAQAQSSVKATAHVAYLGWESAVYDGKVAGTTGKSFEMEAFQIALQNEVANQGGIEYRSAGVDEGYQGWVSNGATSGTTGQGKPLEQIQIQLTGSAADNYDVYYRAHVSNIGWLGWAKNGESAGSSGYGYGIEAMEVVLVDKGGEAPGSTEMPFDKRGPTVKYSAHVENIGWQTAVRSPKIAGTTGKALQVEALEAHLDGFDYSGDIQIAAHVQNIGWQDYVGPDGFAGTTGECLRLEAMKIRLTDEMAEHFDVYYRVHAQNFGWLGWAKNGEKAGTEGYAFRLEAMQIVLVEKGGEAPGSTATPYVKKGVSLEYTAHVQNIGWQNPVESPGTAGTMGEGLRVEALKANLNSSDYAGDLQISTHVQNIGWQDFVGSGEIAGTTGEALRLEALKVRLTGEIADYYDVYYRVHAQYFGWLGWAKNGESAGTAGFAFRLEAIEIALVEKGGEAPGSTNRTFIQGPTLFEYAAHVENIGWQDPVESPGMAGTTGEGLQVEAVYATLLGFDCSGDIQISAHVQNIGWQDYVGSGKIAGTTGKVLRLEAMRVRLTGEMADLYDVYYRVHAQYFGWLGWAKNGESAGTAGYGYRLEAIEIALVDKGGEAPGSTEKPFIEKQSDIMGDSQ
ncbi:MAG: N-acetylmuramoyl-L-alanine amidase, partial [Eggerthellaceae bacterium]|nr:N-acetylmuramoyl-L-alanine amidase [Eggerthellaceae bacterium]